MMRITAFLTAALALANVACVGTDVGNPLTDGGIPGGADAAPPVTLNLDFVLYNRQDPAVSSAWLVVERIRLRSAAACDGDARIEIDGPIAVDLLAAGAPPALTGLEAPAGGYCRFEARWDAFSSGLPPEAPPELVEAAIAIRGQRTDGTPFLLRSDRGDELRLDAADGAFFTIDEATRALFVGLDLTRLFAGVDLGAAAVDGDGTIYIDEDRNSDLLDVFEDNLRDAADLFDDDDGDGELSPGEYDDDDVLAG